MMSRAARQAGAAWLFLTAATLMTFWSSGHVGLQDAAVGLSMILAAAKVLVVLHGFMDLGRSTLPVRVFFYLWTVGSAAMIFGFALRG